MYRISKLIFPRVVALISSKLGNKFNVMTASFLMPISFNPKIIAVAIAKERYSFEIISKSKEFGVNICSKEQKDIAIFAGSYSGRDVDKVKKLNLEFEGKLKLAIKNFPISLECKVIDTRKYGDHYLFVGKVVNEIVRIDINKFEPLLHYYGSKFD